MKTSTLPGFPAIARTLRASRCVVVPTGVGGYGGARRILSLDAASHSRRTARCRELVTSASLLKDEIPRTLCAPRSAQFTRLAVPSPDPRSSHAELARRQLQS